MGNKSRRAGGLAGLSLAATAGLLGTYVAYPGLRRAHAVPGDTCTVFLTTDTPGSRIPGELRDCLYEFSLFTDPAFIEFDPVTNGTTIELDGSLPSVNLASSLTITGLGKSSTVIDAKGYSGLEIRRYGSFTVDEIAISGLTVSNADNASSSGGALSILGSGDTDVAISDVAFRQNDSTSYGGGAVAITSASSVTVSDSTFSGNESGQYGGALMSDGDISITNSTFSGNVTRLGGGAIYASGDGVTVTNSTFSGNAAATYKGGAISTSSGDVIVTSSRFLGNTADNDGGAISTFSGDVTVTVSTFSGNSSIDQDGGALSTFNGDLTVTSSTFSGNSADISGGAISTSAAYPYSSGQVSVTESTFSGNTVGTGGGAIFTYDRTGGGGVAVTNSTFTENSADPGGGAIESTGNVTLDFVTIAGNTSSYSPAVYSIRDVTVANSIVHGNSVGDVYARGVLTASYSLFTSRSSIVSPSITDSALIFDEDPLLSLLGNYGGPTLTMMPAADSPVIGMADPTGAPATDQRGFSRTTNGLADMGAVEVGGVVPEPDLSQLPPSWFQATTRAQQDDPCPAGMVPSWAEWPNEGRGGWTCEWVTWWDPNKGSTGDWVTTPGFNVGRRPGQ